jgi:hypothetical protein
MDHLHVPCNGVKYIYMYMNIDFHCKRVSKWAYKKISTVPYYGKMVHITLGLWCLMHFQQYHGEGNRSTWKKHRPAASH